MPGHLIMGKSVVKRIKGGEKQEHNYFCISIMRTRAKKEKWHISQAART